MKSGLLFACFFGLLSLRAAEMIPVVTAVRPAAVSGVFYQGGPLHFTLSDAIPLDAEYGVRDHSGKTVAEGKVRKKLLIPSLPCGYYCLSFSAPGKQFEPMSFAVVADLSRRKTCAYSVDTAQSFLAHADSKNVRFPGEKFDVVSELALRAGYRVVRDRFGWARCEKHPGDFKHEHAWRNASRLSGSGIKVVTPFDMAPEWLRREGELPCDLLKLYYSAKFFAQEYRGRITGWEYFNEPDGFLRGPSWLLAAGTKTFSLAVRAGNPEALVLGSAFCVTPLQPYAHTVLRNGIAPYIDVFNYHSYVDVAEYPAIAAKLRSALAGHGLERMPVMLTEIGSTVEKDGKGTTYLPGYHAHTPEQERMVAEFLPKAHVVMQANGIARSFFFTLCPYWENHGRKDWGMLRLDLTVKPSYVAAAALNAALGDAKLLGTYSCGSGVESCLYAKPDGSQTLVFWSRDKKSHPVRLSGMRGKFVLRNLYGTPSQISSEKGTIALTAGNAPQYLSGLQGLKPDSPAPPDFMDRKRPVPREDLAIVLNPRLGEGFRPGGSMAYAEQGKIPGRIKLEIYNFSAETKLGSIRLSGGSASGLPAEVTVAPFAKEVLDLEVTPAIPPEDFRTDLIFSGTFNGKKITPAVVPVLQTAALFRDGAGTELHWQDPARWRQNSAGTSEFIFDEKERAMRIRTVFPAGASGRWVFPGYKLELPGESLRDAIGATFEIKADNQIRKGAEFTAMLAVLNTEKDRGKQIWMRFPQVSERWEKRMVMFGGFVPEEAGQLRIGMIPKADDFTFFVRNLRIICVRPEIPVPHSFKK